MHGAAFLCVVHGCRAREPSVRERGVAVELEWLLCNGDGTRATCTSVEDWKRFGCWRASSTRVFACVYVRRVADRPRLRRESYAAETWLVLQRAERGTSTTTRSYAAGERAHGTRNKRMTAGEAVVERQARSERAKQQRRGATKEAEEEETEATQQQKTHQRTNDKTAKSCVGYAS